MVARVHALYPSLYTGTCGMYRRDGGGERERDKETAACRAFLGAIYMFFFFFRAGAARSFIGAARSRVRAEVSLDF